MRRAAVAISVAALGACSAVYDAQYNDRRTELEKSRVLFLDGSTNVQFFTAAQDRLFWVDTPRAIEANEMHSIDARGSGGQIDYPWSGNSVSSAFGANQLATDDTLAVVCNVGQAFDAGANDILNSPYPMLDVGSFGTTSTACTVAGNQAFYVDNSNPPASIVLWEPDMGSNAVPFLALADNLDVNPNGFGFAGGSNILYQDGEDIWLLPTDDAMPMEPLNGGQAPVEAGAITWDEEGDTFASINSDVVFIRFSDNTIDGAPATAVSDLIAQGGYSLNFEHSDVQNILSGANYTVYDHHLIYEANGGIFALGLDTGNVTDILLNGLTDSEGNVAPQYRSPTVTANGTLYVEDDDVLAELHPVYSVDLTGRLQ